MQWVVRWKYQNIHEGISVVEAPTGEGALIKAIMERQVSNEYLSLGAKFTVYRVGAWH